MAKKNWTHAAGVIWPKLVEAGSNRRTLTYKEVAQKIKTNPLSVGRALGPIQDYCLENRLAPLTAIVVHASDGLPGDGFMAWDVKDYESARDAVAAQNWDLVGNPFAGFGPEDDENTLADELTKRPGSSEKVYRKVQDRGMAQRIFRLALLKAYAGRCAACGLSFMSALEAAHIVPWGDCKPAERLDVKNGLLLCASHHSMFDADVFTVDGDLKMTFHLPQAADRRYSKMDQAVGPALHGKNLTLPEDKRLRPDPDYVNRRAEAIA